MAAGLRRRVSGIADDVDPSGSADRPRRAAVAGRDGIKLETAVTGSEKPGPLRELIGAGDVLVSTAGPFLKVGRAVMEAAVDAGAVYLDSAGEPPFIRQVFEEFGPRAERTGAVLLTAFGYDYLPGNLAGALALQAAGPAAARVQVGYFVRGNIRKATSAGTRASAAGVLLEPGYSVRGGRLVTEADRRARRIVRSRRQQAARFLHRLIRAFRAAPRGRTPDRRGSVLVHRSCPRLGRGPGRRARRAARRRARPGGSIRTHQPRKSLRRGRISSKARREGCLMDAGGLTA
jgi:hypothetical protein